MKICVVIQSDAFRASAGMRIRYDRFAESIDEPDISIEVKTCAELTAADRLGHDAYVFCKTFDTSALLLARRMRAERKAVGQDVFDDYFSQYADPRLQRYRDWMREMAPVTDFAICTTPRIAEVLCGYMPDVPIVAVDDPVTAAGSNAPGALADDKLALARESGTLEIAWFGIGDNPYFPVGLSDLAGCEPELAYMQRLGWQIRLTIVTNRRAFEGSSGEALRGLGVGFDLVEWTEEAEREVLDRATIALLPVSGQGFSRAKSLNRALTALSSGCQVLSTGFPLYDRLDDFIYRSAAALLSDIDDRACKLSGQSAQALATRVSEVGDPARSAGKFVNAAVEGVRKASAARGRPPVVCVIHGRRSKIDYHKAVQRIGGLSISTIFTEARWNFPVRFDLVADGVAMRATGAVATRFDLPVKDREATVRIGDFDFVEVDLEALGVEPLRVFLSSQTLIQDAVLYAPMFDFAERCCAAAFGNVDIVTSDMSPLVAWPRRRFEQQPNRPVSKKLQSVHLPQFTRSRSLAPKSGLFDKIARGLGRRRASSEAGEGARLLSDCALFDRRWYLETYSDVAASRVDPLRHYLELGWREGRDPSAEFSSKLYLKDNPDVAGQEVNPLVHYIKCGQFEGRKVRRRIEPGTAR